MIIHSHYKQLEPVSTAEGFAEVVNVRFVPGPWANTEADAFARTLLLSYMMEK
jgi:hypothetical protein